MCQLLSSEIARRGTQDGRHADFVVLACKVVRITREIDARLEQAVVGKLAAVERQKNDTTLPSAQNLGNKIRLQVRGQLHQLRLVVGALHVDHFYLCHRAFAHADIVKLHIVGGKAHIAHIDGEVAIHLHGLLHHTALHRQPQRLRTAFEIDSHLFIEHTQETGIVGQINRSAAARRDAIRGHPALHTAARGLNAPNAAGLRLLICQNKRRCAGSAELHFSNAYKIPIRDGLSHCGCGPQTHKEEQR